MRNPHAALEKSRSSTERITRLIVLCGRGSGSFGNHCVYKWFGLLKKMKELIKELISSAVTIE
jgi:hypothetical protein